MLIHYVLQLRHRTNCLSADEWIKKTVVCIYNGILLTHRKNEIIPFAATQMDLQVTILNKGSQKEKDKDSMVSFICGI